MVIWETSCLLWISSWFTKQWACDSYDSAHSSFRAPCIVFLGFHFFPSHFRRKNTGIVSYSKLPQRSCRDVHVIVPHDPNWMMCGGTHTHLQDDLVARVITIDSTLSSPRVCVMNCIIPDRRNTTPLRGGGISWGPSWVIPWEGWFPPPLFDSLRGVIPWEGWFPPPLSGNQTGYCVYYLV